MSTQVKRKGKMVTLYSQMEMLQSFDRPRVANPSEAHPGTRDGVDMWHESVAFLPDHIEGWTAVNQAKSHYRSGEHHVSVQDRKLIYWVEAEQGQDQLTEADEGDEDSDEDEQLSA